MFLKIIVLKIKRAKNLPLGSCWREDWKIKLLSIINVKKNKNVQAILTAVPSYFSSIYCCDGVDKSLYFTFHFIESLIQQLAWWFIGLKVNLSPFCLTDSETLSRGKKRSVHYLIAGDKEMTHSLLSLWIQRHSQECHVARAEAAYVQQSHVLCYVDSWDHRTIPAGLHIA